MIANMQEEEVERVLKIFRVAHPQAAAAAAAAETVTSECIRDGEGSEGLIEHESSF